MALEKKSASMLDIQRRHKDLRELCLFADAGSYNAWAQVMFSTPLSNPYPVSESLFQRMRRGSCLSTTPPLIAYNPKTRRFFVFHDPELICRQSDAHAYNAMMQKTLIAAVNNLEVARGKVDGPIRGLASGFRPMTDEAFFELCVGEQGDFFGRLARASETYEATAAAAAAAAAVAAAAAENQYTEGQEEAMGTFDAMTGEVERLTAEAETEKRMKAYKKYGIAAVAVVGLGYLGYRLLAPKKKKHALRRKRR